MLLPFPACSIFVVNVFCTPIVNPFHFFSYHLELDLEILNFMDKICSKSSFQLQFGGWALDVLHPYWISAPVQPCRVLHGVIVQLLNNFFKTFFCAVGSKCHVSINYFKLKTSKVDLVFQLASGNCFFCLF